MIGPSLDNPAVIRWGCQKPVQNYQQGLTVSSRTIHHIRQTPAGFVELHRPHLRKRRVDRAVRPKGRCREGGFGRFMYQYQELTPFLTLPALKALNARALDFADSLMPKGSSIDDLSDFNDALNELTGVIDNLDEPTASAGSQPAGRPYPNESLAYNF